MSNFNPTKPPSYSTSVDVSFRVLRADYGDGYNQRIGDGVNARKETWNLTWNDLTNDEADNITDFFDTQAGVTSFTWTTPNGDTNSFIVGEYSRNLTNFNSTTVTATLEQVFGS